MSTRTDMRRRRTGQHTFRAGPRGLGDDATPAVGLRLAAIVATAVCSVAALTAVQWRAGQRIDATWRSVEHIETAKLRALERFEASMGYDAGIHAFKNYVLRGDDRYAERSARAFSRARAALERYRSIGHLTPRERDAIGTLEGLLDAYGASLKRIWGRSLSPTEADRLARVDDTEFALALATVRSRLELARARATANVQRTIAHAQRAAVLLGGLAVASVLGGGLWLSWRLRARLAAFHRVQSRLANFARLSGDAMLMTDPEERIVWVNQEFTRITGYSPDEVLGKRPGDFLPVADANERTRREMRSAIRDRRPFRGQLLNRNKDGRDRWMRVEIVPETDARGVLTGFISVQSDITEAVRSEAALKQLLAQRTELTAAIEHSPTPTLIVDTAGVALFAKHAAAELDARLGFELRPGHPTLLFSRPFTDERLASRLIETVTRGDRFVERVRVGGSSGGDATPEAEEVWLQIEAAPLRDEHGEVTRIVLIKSDISADVATDRAAAERAELADARSRIAEILSGERALAARCGEALEVMLATGPFRHVASARLVRDDGPSGALACAGDLPADRSPEERAPTRDAAAGGCVSVPLVDRSHRVGELFVVMRDGASPSRGLAALLGSFAELFTGAIVRNEHRCALQRAALEVEQRRLELRTIIDAFPGFVLYKDDRNTILDCNRAAAAFIGVPPERVRGRPADAFFSEADAQFRHDDPALFRTGKPEIGGISAHGTGPEGPRYFRTDKIPLHGASGSFERLVVVATDITDTVRAKRQLEALQAKLTRAAAGTSDGLWECDPQTGETWYADTFKRLIGVSPEAEAEFAPTLDAWLDRTHPDDVGALRNAIARAARGANAEDVGFDLEHRVRLPGGEYRWFRARARSAPDAEGGAIRLSGSISDVHDHHTAQSRLDLATRTARVGLWDWDIPSGQTFFSDAYSTVLGYRPGELPMNVVTWAELVHPDDLERVLAAIEAHFEDPGVEYSAEFRLRRADGSWHWVRAAGEVVERRPDGSPQRMVGVHIDIQQLREALSEAERASAEKTLFLANMSHEIRTPMTAILGYADLLADEEDDVAGDPVRAAEAVHTIRANAHHLLTIINDILDVSKIEAGQIALEHADVDPVSVIHETAALLGPRAQSKGLALRVRFDTPMPDRIRTDPTRLRQILINLAGNAIKFTESGTVTLSASCDAARRTLSVRVRDTGIGLTSEQLETVRRFEAFTQADPSLTRRFGGAGLGLRICHGLAGLLGGRIDIESEFGRGSTFGVHIDAGDLSDARWSDRPALPAAAERGPKPVRREDPTAGPDRPLEGVRILLAEDGPDNQRLIAHHLRRAGASVEIRENGRHAVDFVMRAPPGGAPHLVLMDMQMPELDGYGATRALRRAGVRLPIVALTAHAMEGDRERCLDAGCDDYLTKPIDRRALVDACRRWATRRGDEHSGGGDSLAEPDAA